MEAFKLIAFGTVRSVLLMVMILVIAVPGVAFGAQDEADVQTAAYINDSTGQKIMVRVEFMGSGFPGEGYLSALVDAARVQQELPGLEVWQEQPLSPDALASTGADAGEMYMAVESHTSLGGFVLVLVQEDYMSMIGFIGFDPATDMATAFSFSAEVVKDGVEVSPPDGFGAGQGTSGPTGDMQCSGPVGDDAAALGPLDGRLGGSVTSFNAVYGAPTDDGFFREYTIPGCGPVLVSDFEGSTVVTVHLFAPREGEDQDYWEPNEADWTIDEAKMIAESFLPADTVLEVPMGDMSPPAPGMLADEIEVRGWSQTLLENVPTTAWDYVDNTPIYGGCSYWLLRTYSGDVSNIVVELRIEE